MKYKICDLQTFVTPDAEKMMEFHGLPETEFEFQGTIRTLLFIDCGLVRGDLNSGGHDYYQVIGRLYESADPEGEDEKHKGKLYINVYETSGSLRFEAKVERFEWHADGSFDVISQDGNRKTVAVGPDFSMKNRTAVRDTVVQKINEALALNQSGRYQEANALFREILPQVEDISTRFFCSWLIAKELLVRIKDHGSFPRHGSALYDETCKYLRIALETYDRAADYLKQDAAEDIVAFRELLKLLQRENSKDQPRAKMQQLGDAYPETLTIIRSANEIDRFMQKVGNNVEMKGPFNNGDKEMFNVMEEALSAGKQVAVQAFGPDKLLVIIGKPSSGACFIATAVFGSPFATEVVVFRQFRDEVLLRSKIGTAFVLLYYRVAPPLSLVIASSELLKKLTQKLLLKPLLKLIALKERQGHSRV